MGIENWFWIGFAGGGVSLLFALFQLWRLLRREKPAPGLSLALRKGSLVYLKWQLLLSVGGLALAFLLLTGLSDLGLLEERLPTAFLSSGLCGLLAGLAAALIPPAAAPRAAGAAGQRLDRGAHTVFSAGAVTGFLAVGLALLHLTGWLFLLRQTDGIGLDTVVRLLPFFGLGSAFSALLFHMGALFARSAEMTAGSAAREMGLPPVSPWNPAVIAQGVGRGTGAASGVAAVLYCIYETLLSAALLLGVSAYAAVDMAWNAMFLPLAVAVAGALLSPAGFLTLRPMERGDRRSLPRQLRLAALIPALLTAAVTVPLAYLLMGSWQLCPPVFLGLAAGLLIPLVGEYCTSDTGRPARSLARAGAAGATAAATGALGSGICLSLLPLLLTAGVLMAAFWTVGGMAESARGLYGVALAGVGMLSVSGVTLTAAESGPIGSSACFTASLSETGETQIPRHGADSLAAMGASAANGGKCFAAAAAGLAGSVLLARLAQLGEEPPRLGLSLVLGMAVGIMAVLLFPGLLLRGVHGSARSALALIRRRFPDPSEPPDHAVCVRRCSSRSLLGFLPPLLLALALPLAVGVLLRSQGLAGYAGAVLLLSVTASLPLTLSGGLLGGARRHLEGGRDPDGYRSLLAAEDAAASLSQVLSTALPALAMFSLTLSLLCLPLLEYIPPLWG